ncbi:EscI/YscI/HrpB family type III secretion system inner rod protein (plasmid) [Bradyrhizobium sp. Pa8]|uniref:EscI/YscI/HrpB family type III secretion system inner rod protein n=1 Tax=Bradyrhizobium sp. Pa8 TaxID=3386552 RepID=UPI00403F8062
MSSVSSILPQVGTTILATETPPSSPRLNVSAESVEAFRAALERPVPSQSGDGALIVAGDGLPEQERGASAPRISDGILSDMDELDGSFAQTMEAARTAVEGINSGQLHSAEWLNVQLALSAMTLKYDIAAKVVGRVTQNLDTFLKSQ